MEINSQAPAYINPQTTVLKQEAVEHAQNVFQPPAPAEASNERQAYPDESRQKANINSSLWQAAQRSNQSQGMEQGVDGLDTFTDNPNKRSVQAMAAYEAVQKPENKVSLDAII